MIRGVEVKLTGDGEGNHYHISSGAEGKVLEVLKGSGKIQLFWNCCYN